MASEQEQISEAAKATAPLAQERVPVEGLVAFLETVPPGEEVKVLGFAERGRDVDRSPTIVHADLLLYCGHKLCQGSRNFQPRFSTTEYVQSERSSLRYLTYSCRNCQTTEKTFAIWFKVDATGVNAAAFKFGESPEFGPPLTPRVLMLLEADKDELRKGYRSERQGLGVGAFGYYRRVVENQKNRIIDELIRVATVFNPSDEVLEDLRAAKAETQFTKAVDQIKHGLPQSLLIDGHNPLKLLHGALSEGLHARTDADCLADATAIRIVLTDLADRMAQAIKDDAELKSAVGKLLNRKRPSVAT